jgi:hypothetical protein
MKWKAHGHDGTKHFTCICDGMSFTCEWLGDKKLHGEDVDQWEITGKPVKPIRFTVPVDAAISYKKYYENVTSNATKLVSKMGKVESKTETSVTLKFYKTAPKRSGYYFVYLNEETEEPELVYVTDNTVFGYHSNASFSVDDCVGWQWSRRINFRRAK